MTPAEHGVLKRQILLLTVEAAEVKKKMPSRSGKYSISLKEFMAATGRERLTEGLIKSVMEASTKIVNNAVDSVELDLENNEIVFDFNHRLEVVNDRVFLGRFAYKPPTKENHMSFQEYFAASDAKRVHAALLKIQPDGTHAGAFGHQLVDAFLRELNIQDQTFSILADNDTAKAFNEFRVYLSNLGRDQGSLLKAHLVMGEDTLVYAHPDVFEAVINPPAKSLVTGRAYEGLFDDTKKAHVVMNVTSFIDELQTCKYSQAIVIGTDSFQGYLDRGLTELRELTFEALVGDLPRLYVLN